MVNRKCTALPGGVTLKVATWDWGFSVEYLGTLEALSEVGAYTEAMRSNHQKYRRGNARGLRDEHDQRFTLHWARTKTDPLRMRLSRSVPREIAAEVAGMRELFPDGIPGPLADVQERCETQPAPREQTREEKMVAVTTMLNTIGGYLAADLCTPESQSRIGAHISGIMAEFDREVLPSRGHLRLVVDNTEVRRGDY